MHGTIIYRIAMTPPFHLRAGGHPLACYKAHAARRPPMTLARRQLPQFAAAAPLLALRSKLAAAEAYPTRPVRVIVTTGPGGQGDTTARLVAAKLSENLGQSFYIENMPGGGGNIAMMATARAAPDGYTLLAATSNIVTNISLYPKIAYDPYRDFDPISQMWLRRTSWWSIRRYPPPPSM